MTTPRVTVPVEPTLPLHPESTRIAAVLRAKAEKLGKGVPSDLPGFHKDLWTAAEIIDMAEQGRAFDHQMNAMLSAAPAPEGGAVSIWSDARNVFVRYAELFAMTERYEEASAIADKAAREIETLATREEAPAEAGEQSGGQIAFDAWNGREGDPYWFLESDAWRQRWERVAVALHAQPQAREDAQPVWVDGVPTKHHAKEWFIAETTFGDRVVLTALPEEYAYDFKTADETYIKADRIKRWMPFPDSQYLFPHPATDALRVAVEALEAAKTLAMKHAPLSVAPKIIKALAALQQEGR